jgi:hypothetical protein
MHFIIFTTMLSTAISFRQFQPHGLHCSSSTSHTDILDQICLFHNGYPSDCEYIPSATSDQEFTNHLEKICKANNTEIAPRGAHQIAQNSLLSETISSISQYGCWCDFENGMKHGAGKPVNAVDEACRDLQLGYQCVKIDSRENQDHCDPDNTDYTLTFGVDVEFLDFMCNLLNDYDPCKARLCALESYFLGTLMNLSLEPENQFAIKYQRLEIGGPFDFRENCLGVKSGSVVHQSVNHLEEEIDFYDYFMEHDRGIEIDSPDSEHSSFATEVHDSVPNKEFLFAPAVASLNSNVAPVIATVNTNVLTGNDFENVAQQLANNQLSAPTLKTCCGVYPMRKPMKPGKEQCCDQETIFQTETQECCSRGWRFEVVPLGTC